MQNLETHPSRLAIKALGLSPEVPYLAVSDIADKDTLCCYCGHPIKKGEPVQFRPLRNNNSFLDGNEMAYRNSRTACQWCHAITRKIVMPKTFATVFTEQGAYPIFKDIHRAWLFTTPPKPPYLVTVANAKSQHLVWRTPVTLDSEMMTVRYGPNLFVIRQLVLSKLVDFCREAAEILNSDPESIKKKRKYSHPFMFLDRKCENLHHGLLLPKADEIAQDNKRMAEIFLPALQRATIGELWALATLVKKDTPIPEQPRIIQLNLL